MRTVNFIVFILLAFACQASTAQLSAAIAEKLNITTQHVAAVQKTKAGIYAKDVIERSKERLVRGQLDGEAGNDVVANQELDIAELLLQLATVTAEERESSELTATKRSELKTLEIRIDGFLRGKEL